MHISQLIGTIFRGMEPARSEALQLRPGQIVRAQILSMLSNEEALLQIGDVKVIGKLEAKIAVGETAWLQVQSRLATGQLSMKAIQLEGSNTGLNGSFDQLLSALGLKNTPANHEMVKTLVQQQVPLTKESAKMFEGIVNLLAPKGIKDAHEFNAVLRALVVADKKGLPITEQSIKGIAEFASEEPVHAKVSSLIKEIDTAIASKQLPLSSEQKIIQLKNQLANLFLNLDLDEMPLQLRTVNTSSTPASVQGLPNSEAMSASPKVSGQNSLVNDEGVNVNASVTNSRSLGVTNQGQQHANILNASTMQDSLAVSNKNTTDNPRETLRPDVNQPAAQVENENISNPSNAEKVPISLKTMGLEHEHALKLHGANDNASLMKELTVKNIVLSLQQDNLSSMPALKEAADKVLNHITGQQLMLVPNQQTESYFSQLIMQLPIDFQGQKNTASIQFEWKDKKKGSQKQVDLENCRIFFNLSMENIGLTFVDVSIVNKIISIKIYNDIENVKDQFAPFLASLQENVEALGYRFSGFSYAALPDSEKGQKLLQSYAALDYKGVDIRV